MSYYNKPLPPTPPGGSGPNPFLTALLGGYPTTIRDRYYKGQHIRLDGYTFINCCFHNCTLQTDTGVFAIDSCTIANCTILFGQNAVRIVKLYNCIDTLSTTGFTPTVGADGALTIK